MPDQRLDRTRDPKPEVPPCVRLGHLMQYVGADATERCLRCHLTVDAISGEVLHSGRQ